MKNITRRDFVKGMAAAGAGVGLVTILPNGVITSADAAWGWPTVDSKPTGNIVTNWWGSILEAWLPKVKKDGIYIEGNTENMNNKTYTLEFVQPVKLVAVVDKEVQTEGTWKSSAKHLVSVDPDGTVVMRDGVGGYDVDITWTLGDKSFTVTFHTSQTAGGYSIEVDRPMTRGDFMIRLHKYCGWYHYTAVMDDGTDIDDNGEYAESIRVRNYADVTGVADYVKPIEAALDNHILKAESSDECFYPMSQMTRQDAAVIICSAFHLESLDKDYISGFADASKIDPECYDALNTLVGRNFMRGRTNDTLNPTDAITHTEARIIIEELDGRVAAPVWGTPVSNRKLNRIRPELFSHNGTQSTIKYRFRCFNLSHPELEGLSAQDVKNLSNDGEWTDWIDYNQDHTIDAYFGMQSSHFLPYDTVWHCIEFEAYNTMEGKEDSGVTHFVWRLERAPWHDFATDKLHEGDDNYPTVYRYFDNFQAAAYYIEGSKMGIIFDGLSSTNTNLTLYDRVKEVATKPFIFVLGHNHGDHKGALAPCHIAGVDVYLCDRVGPQGSSYTVQIRPEDWLSNDKPGTGETKKITGSLTGDNVHIIKEGHVFDLGNCKFEVVQLPGHSNDDMLLYSRETGLLFASDIYGVNRYWVADQFSAKGVKQDLVLSLQQQLMDFYTKDGGQIKEMYTGHNRIGVGPDYLTIWERCLQKQIDFGPFDITDDRRGTGAILSRDGDPYDEGTAMNWCGFTINGKMERVEYTDLYGKKFYRLEPKPDSGIEGNLLYDWKTVSALSNISFRDAELVGHDFNYKTGQKGFDDVLEDGRLKYVIENKFVPMDTEYEVKIAKGQKNVTFTPVAMSNRIQSLTVNGEAHSSRCPITVKTNKNAVITVVGPDGSESTTYTLTFVEA